MSVVALEPCRISRPLILVAAIARNGVLGYGNAIPWRLASDLKHFRRLTLGKPLLMGRKTYQSIGAPLPGRISIVLSRNAAFPVPRDVQVVPDIEAALDAAEVAAQSLGADAIALIGGAGLFSGLIDRVTRMHLTFVDLAPTGDTFFPPIDWSLWQEIARETHAPQIGDDASFTFVDFARRQPVAAAIAGEWRLDSSGTEGALMNSVKTKPLWLD